jgi:hypothetical protein
MPTVELPLLLDLAVSAGIIFITVWFFFVQSPFLFQRLGRQKFVPIMMQITQLYFKTIILLNIAVFSLSFVQQGETTAAAVALVATSVNHFVIVPKALAKGRKSMKERVNTDNSSNVKDFVIEGGSTTETKTMHQMVVLFVLVDVGALVAHLLLS